ncbi:MAG: DUF1294 domain-containing protein [bacterium]
MNNLLLFLLSFFAILNVVAFLVMLLDKIKSTQPYAERISEGMLFFIAAFFGSLGVYLGMFIFRHKTRKWYFVVGVPLIFLQNLATIFLVYDFVMNRLNN